VQGPGAAGAGSQSCRCRISELPAQGPGAAGAGVCGAV